LRGWEEGSLAVRSLALFRGYVKLKCLTTTWFVVVVVVIATTTTTTAITIAIIIEPNITSTIYYSSIVTVIIIIIFIKNEPFEISLEIICLFDLPRCNIFSYRHGVMLVRKPMICMFVINRDELFACILTL